MAAPPQRARPHAVEELSVTLLIARCRLGDDAAWREVVRRYGRLVYSISMREGLSEDQAADVCQATFAALCASLDKLRDPERLGWWLMTVARRQVWRINAGRSVVEPHDPTDLADLHDIAELQEVLAFDDELLKVAWVHDAVAALGEPCRTLVHHLFFDGREPSYQEIAASTNLAVGSIGPMRGRCLNQLRRLLEPTQEPANEPEESGEVDGVSPQSEGAGK